LIQRQINTGVSLRKLRDGTHTWQVGVVAGGDSIDDLRAAVDVAAAIDGELEERYDKPDNADGDDPIPDW
jgi:hypothetical protein